MFLRKNFNRKTRRTQLTIVYEIEAYREQPGTKPCSAPVTWMLRTGNARI